jgi:hypothetical protein
VSAAAVTWRAESACVLTFSLRGRRAARRAARAALAAVPAPGGATLAAAVGTWQGRRERAYTLAMVGRSAPPLAVLRALRAAGCAAIQVETFSPRGYSVREVRP